MSFFNSRWFHGHISGTDSERLMLDKGKSGSFMVRESVTNPGNFVVTARFVLTISILNEKYIKPLILNSLSAGIFTVFGLKIDY